MRQGSLGARFVRAPDLHDNRLGNLLTEHARYRNTKNIPRRIDASRTCTCVNAMYNAFQVGFFTGNPRKRQPRDPINRTGRYQIEIKPSTLTIVPSTWIVFAPVWYQSGSCLASVWYQCGICTVLASVWYQYGPSGPSLVPMWCPSESNLGSG